MPTRPPTRKPGRPQHVPDDFSKARVMALSGDGIRQDEIAASLGITRPTLAKHYQQQLNVGKATIDGLAISTLALAMQRGGKEALVAAKWWTQARMGWSKKLLVADGPANVPMRVTIELVGDPAPVAAEHTAR